jgi:hypothetical protein
MCGLTKMYQKFSKTELTANNDYTETIAGVNLFLRRMRGKFTHFLSVLKARWKTGSGSSCLHVRNSFFCAFLGLHLPGLMIL